MPVADIIHLVGYPNGSELTRTVLALPTKGYGWLMATKFENGVVETGWSTDGEGFYLAAGMDRTDDPAPDDLMKAIEARIDERALYHDEKMLFACRNRSGIMFHFFENQDDVVDPGSKPR